MTTAVRHGEGTLRSGQYWQGWSVPDPVGVVVLVHGVHEHGGRYAHVAERLGAAGYSSYAPDHPGHGRSPGRRGDIGSLAAAVEGVAQTALAAADRHPGVPLFLYGHSLGGLVALQYLTGQPHERLAGGVVSAPALDTSTATPVQRVVAPVLSRLAPGLGVLTLDVATISRDPAVVAAYRADPLTHTGRMVARTGTEIMAGAAGMPARLRGLRLPLLVLHGGGDRLMPPSASEVVREHAGSPDLTVRIWDGLYHEPHNEPEKDRVLDDVVAWLDAHRTTGRALAGPGGPWQGRTAAPAAPEGGHVPRTVPDGLRLLRAFVAHPRRIGAVLPTSGIAVRAMLDLADVPSADLVVELGAGTGVATREILARLGDDARLVAVEIDPQLARRLTEDLGDDPRLQVVCDSAEDLGTHLGAERADVVVSMLPFTSLEAGLRRRLLDQLPRVLRPDGAAVVIQYSPLVLGELRRRFTGVRTRVTPWNVPPAFLFGCTGPVLR